MAEALAPGLQLFCVGLNHETTPIEEKGTERVASMCDGRWLWADFNGQFSGAPFSGSWLYGIDPKTKAFTEPAAAIKQEIAEVTANKTMPAREKKQMLEELNEALKSAQPIQFPANIELVKKYYDKINGALQ